MKKKHHTEGQIYGILKEAEAGANTADLRRKHGIAPNTFYRWKAKYGGMELNIMRRLKEMENENLRLKKLVAQYALETDAMKDVIEKRI